MIFIETALKGAFIVEPEPRGDERGFFARVWCALEFEKAGIHMRPLQANISFNREKGTLRGLHYQTDPFGEAKFLWCTAGAIHDVIVDLRADSKSFMRWFSVELSRENRRALFVPKGIAHGFLTLRDNTEVFYQMSQLYMPEYARGIRWNDPAFKIKWPADVKVISEKDARWPDFSKPMAKS